MAQVDVKVEGFDQLNSSQFPNENPTGNVETAQAATAPAPRANNIQSLLTGSMVQMPLSANGEKFKEMLVQQASIAGLKVFNWNQGVNASIVCDDKDSNAIILIYSESITQGRLGSDEGRQIAVAWRNSFNGTDPNTGAVIPCPDDAHYVDQTFVVTESMYDRAAIISHNVINCVKSMTGTTSLENLTLAELNIGKLHVSDNLEDAKNLVAMYSPTAIPPRADFGIVIEHVDKNKTAQHVYLPGGQQRQEETRIPAMAITAYVDFVRTTNVLTQGVDRFVPVITITGIASLIPSSGMLTLAIPFAIDAFITNRMWMNQFKRLKGKLTKGDRILTHLVPSVAENKNPKSIEQIDRFIHQHIDINETKLILDLRWDDLNIPGTSVMRDDCSHNYLAKTAKFLGCEMQFPQDTKNVFEKVAGVDTVPQEVMGFANAGGSIMDSRELDYLYFMSNGTDPNKLQSLLDLHTWDTRILDQQQLYGVNDVLIAGKTDKLIFAKWFVNEVASKGIGGIIANADRDYAQMGANIIQLASTGPYQSMAIGGGFNQTGQFVNQTGTGPTGSW